MTAASAHRMVQTTPHQPMQNRSSLSAEAQSMDKNALIRRFDLKPHPEGGYFRETYRSSSQVTRESSGPQRSASTAIYYLLSDGAHSAWHRIRSDEVWHFYAGDPIEVHVIDAHGVLTTHRLGNTLTHPDAEFQAV